MVTWVTDYFDGLLLDFFNFEGGNSILLIIILFLNKKWHVGVDYSLGLKTIYLYVCS